MPALLTPDSGLLFWMLIAFLIVFAILAKFGFPVIIQMVEERKKFIDESLVKAREANEKLANIQAESETILREAREQQAQILKEAMDTRNSIIKAAKEQAKDEGNKMLEEVKIQIEAEREKALRNIRAQVVDLSILVAEKVLHNNLNSDSKQKELAGRYMDEININ